MFSYYNISISIGQEASISLTTDQPPYRLKSFDFSALDFTF